jgi:hypothetical protein
VAASCEYGDQTAGSDATDLGVTCGFLLSVQITRSFTCNMDYVCIAFIHQCIIL